MSLRTSFISPQNFYSKTQAFAAYDSKDILGEVTCTSNKPFNMSDVLKIEVAVENKFVIQRENMEDIYFKGGYICRIEASYSVRVDVEFFTSCILISEQNLQLGTHTIHQCIYFIPKYCKREG